MSDLKLERTFDADQETVFSFVTNTEHLVKWWGPEGYTITEHNLNFSQRGSWSSTVINTKGERYKVAGEVLKVDPPNSVEFTWGWHDEDDIRGHESHVRFDVSRAASGQTRLTVTHSGLPDEDSVTRHEGGWSSSLRKIQEIFNP